MLLCHPYYLIFAIGSQEAGPSRENHLSAEAKRQRKRRLNLTDAERAEIHVANKNTEKLKRGLAH